MTWSMDNRVAKEGKGASIAIMNVIGQCGPLLGTRLYPASDAPFYISGMATCSGFMVLVAILAFTLRVILGRQNAATVAASRFGSSAGVHNDDADGIELEMGTYSYGGGDGEGEGLMDDAVVREQSQEHSRELFRNQGQEKNDFLYIL